MAVFDRPRDGTTGQMAAANLFDTGSEKLVTLIRNLPAYSISDSGIPAPKSGSLAASSTLLHYLIECLAKRDYIFQKRKI
jgi:hypothetical protein